MQIDMDNVVWAETTIVSSSGRTSVPKKMRDLLKISPGDCIQWIVMRDGSFVVRNVHKPDVRNPRVSL